MRTNVDGTTKVVHGCQKNGGQDFPFPAAVLMPFCRLWAAKEKMGGPPNHVLSRRQSFQSVAAPVFLTDLIEIASWQTTQDTLGAQRDHRKISQGQSYVSSRTEPKANREPQKRVKRID